MWGLVFRVQVYINMHVCVYARALLRCMQVLAQGVSCFFFSRGVTIFSLLLFFLS